jgi:hypothetical protein
VDRKSRDLASPLAALDRRCGRELPAPAAIREEFAMDVQVGSRCRDVACIDPPRSASLKCRRRSMTVHDLSALGVGKTLTTHEFTVRPADLTAHVESSFLGQVIGTCEECLSTGSLASNNSGGGSPWGRVCPTPVAVDRVLAALAQHEALRDHSVVVRSVGRVRALGELMVGESLTGTAEVRFRSQRVPGATHLTVEVELHRWQGGRRVTLLGFEAGLELHDAAPAAA